MSNPAIRLNQKAEPQKKKKGGLIVLFIIILLVGGIAAAIAMNLFGIRENHILPLLRQIPLVGNLIPAAEYPEWASEPEVDYAAIAAGLEGDVARLQSQLTRLQSDFESLSSRNEDNIRELTRLREIEAQQLVHRDNVDEFERRLAEGDPLAFASFFESINPDHAARLYEEILGINIRDARWASYIALWGALRPAGVAEVIESMIVTDMPLIISVLEELDLSTQRRIVDALDVETRALILRRLNPETP